MKIKGFFIPARSCALLDESFCRSAHTWQFCGESENLKNPRLESAGPMPKQIRYSGSADSDQESATLLLI
jgi:hypothetical protein